MRLDVGEAAAEQLLGALDRQRLDRVRRPAALIVAAARIALGIFVGQHRALRLEHRAADDIFRRDQLDLGLLALQLGLDRRGDRGVGIGQPLGEEAQGLDVGQVGRGGHQSLSCKEFGELVDAALVAPAGEIGAEEGGDAGLGHVAADQARAQARARWRHYARGPAPPTAARRHARAAARGVAVDRDRNADARAADGDPALGLAGGDGVGELGSKLRIIDAFRAVGAEVDDLVAGLAQPGGKLVLQANPAWSAARAMRMADP